MSFQWLSTMFAQSEAQCPREKREGFEVLKHGYGGAMSGGRRWGCEHCQLSTGNPNQSVKGPCLRQVDDYVRPMSAEEIALAERWRWRGC